MSWRPKLIVACHPNLAPVARACRTVSGSSYVVWCHGFETWGAMSRVQRWGLHKADLVIAPSAYTATRTEVAANLRTGSVQVIPHGVIQHDAMKVEWVPHPDPMVLTVSRLEADHAYKGVDRLIEAWPLVLEKHPSARLVIVGDGDARHELAMAAKARGVDASVEFAREVANDELAALYRRASLFALPGRVTENPPRGEGFGLVFVEAAAHGVPVIAGKGGGAMEAVQDGVTGLLVDPNSPAAISDAIVSLLAEPERAREMGEKGSQWVRESFSHERFCKDLVEAMTRLLNGSDT